MTRISGGCYQDEKGRVRMISKPVSDRRDRICVNFKRREQFLLLSVAGMLLVGIPALFVGPLILGSIYWLLTVIWSGSFLVFVSWTWFFWGASLILIPLLFWTELRTQGSYFTEAVLGAGGAPPTAYATGHLIGGREFAVLANFVVHPRVSASGLVELFLTGPRLLLDAARKIRRSRQLRTINRERAAGLVQTLYEVESGLPIDRILRPSEPPTAIVGELAYLLFHDWVGISKTSDRVWLLSDSRRVLA